MRAMLTLLCTDPLGIILLCNIVDGLMDDSISGAYVGHLLIACRRRYCADRSMTATDLVDVIDKTTSAASGPAGAATCLLACRPPLADPCRDVDVGTVMEFGKLSACFLRPSAAISGHGGALAHPDPGDPDLWDAIANLSGRADVFEDTARLGGGPRPLFWLTPAALLPTGGPACPELAESVRDQLGLIHFVTGHILIALGLAGAALRGVTSARPTFLDAGAHRRFRHRPDAPPGPCGQGWGMTAHLGGVLHSAANVDGLPERVSEPIAIKDAGYVGVRPLGEVRTNRGLEVTDDDRAFADRLLRGRTSDELIGQLMRFL
jgi:hypothetical protein